MEHLIIRTEREKYDISEVRGMTVEELIEELSRRNPKAVVAVAMDGGMYGGLRRDSDPIREVKR